jgi:hypothetical protein
MSKRLKALYRARRAALEAEADVLDADDEAEVVQRLRKGFEEAKTEERSERSFRLEVLADVSARAHHRGAIDLLLDILADADESVQAYAARRLADVAMSGRYAELVLATEQKLEQSDEFTGMRYLPQILRAGLLDPEMAPPADVIVRLLDANDAETAAEAASFLAELGLDGAHELLESFALDDRTLDDGTTLGAFVTDLLATLELEDAIGAGPHKPIEN